MRMCKPRLKPIPEPKNKGQNFMARRDAEIGVGGDAAAMYLAVVFAKNTTAITPLLTLYLVI